MSERKFRLGVDLGGTKIEAALLDERGEMVFRERVASPSDSYDEILHCVHQLSLQAEQQAGRQLPLGIGVPGAISPRSGLLRNANTVTLNGRNLQWDLQALLQRPVRLQNDANCFVLSEAMDGAGAGYPIVFGVIIGTGAGGGLVWNRKLLSGHHAIGGEWGHNQLPWLKDFDVVRDCYCGKRGCVETFLSGPGFGANATALTGQSLTSRQIVQGAVEGDQLCRQQMEHYYDQMARALAMVIDIVDPDVIVLGGGMSNIDALYREVPARLGEYVFSDYVDCLILPPRYGDSSGVRGAAWLWDE